MALNSPDDTMTAFFGIFTSASTHKDTDMMALFSGDDAGPPPTPAVGITHHGPNFTTVAEVKKLWHTFFTSFDGFKFVPAKLTLPGQQHDIDAPRLYSKTPYPPTGASIPMAGVQTILSGDFVADWFQKPAHGSGDQDHSSLPLSGIRPVAAAQNGPLHTKIPAFTVFAFNPQSHLIIHLWVYLDRYMLLHDLQPGAAAILAGFATATAQRQHVLNEAKKHRR
jgi:hypothetical protein